MATNNQVRFAAVGVAALALAFTVIPAQASSQRTLPTISRAADGPVDEFGGARRIGGDQSKTIQAAIQKSGAKNVILVIGDGMGDSEITVARNYLEGAGGAFKGIDALPLTGQMTHYSVHKENGKPDYTPDSAATGSAWATGVKTYDNAISVDRHGRPHETLLQLAKKSGKATGDITTSEIQDATPAVQVSHVLLRKCYGPEETSKSCAPNALENGGLGSISEQLLNTRPDVTFGGGSKTFAEKAKAGDWKGQTLEAQAKARGYQYITDKADLATIGSADQRRPVLGLFSSGNMPVRYAETLATSGGGDKAAVQCQANPKASEVPTLASMTKKSIDLLSKNADGRKNGFFLQVESASIDKKDHAADACGQIGETAQLDEAVQEALKFAKKDKNTLVIVTADHAHSSQIVDEVTPGLSIKLRTNEGSDMVVSYGTAAAGESQQHTGSQVRVAGYGPGAANVVGLIDQTDLFFIIRDGMRAYRR
ncbi:alkaline phosphatase [Nigerium sp.]|uniref:alkaline phosphatase n=1 Tax=Nigerium sp. TaxID=2042655 RepID=UPI0032217EBC